MKLLKNLTELVKINLFFGCIISQGIMLSGRKYSEISQNLPKKQSIKSAGVYILANALLFGQGNNSTKKQNWGRNSGSNNKNVCMEWGRNFTVWKIGREEIDTF